MVAKTPQSRKARGRVFQQWVRDLITTVFELREGDVQSTSMGAGGEDIKLSPHARDMFPYSIECKNKEKLNVWEAYKQAEANCKEFEPLLFIKRNRQKPLVVLDAEHFVKLAKEAKRD